MAKIAIMGFGTVGSGVLEVIRRNAAAISRRAGEPVEVKYILDVRDFSGTPDADLFVNNIDVILNDPEIKVVVETIGGTRFAYPYVKACLESGRSVATSNKEMVATYGAELLALAKEHGAAFLFEASVGGGTPIITPMHQCLAANVISEIEGIVNGTTNFMLTKMARENMGFAEALKIAQQLGYAETKDPSDDVDGQDAWPRPRNWVMRKRTPPPMWTATTPAARSASCPAWPTATTSIPRTCRRTASGTFWRRT